MSLPRYLYADSPDINRSFIIRTVEPRFIAEMFDTEDAPVEGLTISQPDRETILGNFEFIDDPGELPIARLLKWGREIQDAMDEYDYRAEKRGETLNRLEKENDV